MLFGTPDNYRITESGGRFYPEFEQRLFGFTIWMNFDGPMPESPERFSTLAEARAFIDEVRKNRKKTTIIHTYQG